MMNSQRIFNQIFGFILTLGLADSAYILYTTHIILSLTNGVLALIMGMFFIYTCVSSDPPRGV